MTIKDKIKLIEQMRNNAWDCFKIFDKNGNDKMADKMLVEMDTYDTVLRILTSDKQAKEYAKIYELEL